MTIEALSPPAASYTAFGLRAEAERIEPGLHLVATPIGNLKDVSFRALSTLAAADAVVAEDTRVTKTLLAHYGISTPLIAYHEHNARVIRPHLLARLEAGAKLALVSDAGTPLVSDPGFQARPGGARERRACDVGARPFRRAGGAGRRRTADRPLLFRRLSAAQKRPAARAARGTRAYSRHAGVFRKPAATGRNARRLRGDSRQTQCGDRPRTDQAVRIGPSRDARRTRGDARRRGAADGARSCCSSPRPAPTRR